MYFLLITSLVFLTSVPTNIVLAHSTLHREVNKKTTFHAWWDEEDVDCIIRFLPKTSTKEASFQVNDGIPISKDQILEIYKEKKYRGTFRSKAYIYHLTYKDENSKVSTSKIIFIDKNTTIKFEKALEELGI
tara:strand:- start:389 stop:784 length:396 start_codon:yes stop_codon:yes gene_type:complete